MRKAKKEILTLKDLINELNKCKTHVLERVAGPISLDILKQYIETVKDMDGLERVSIRYKLNQTKRGTCYYRMSINFAYDNGTFRSFNNHTINGYPYDQITQEQYENSIISKRKYKTNNTSVVIEENVETPEIEVKTTTENKNDNMVLIHEKKTTTIQEERKVMIVNKPSQDVIKMVSENFFEFDKTTARVLKISDTAINLLKTNEVMYKNDLVEKMIIKLSRINFYKDVIDIAKYLLNRGGRYVIVNKEINNTKYALPSVGFTVFKKSYKKTRSNIFGFGINEEEDIKKFFEKMFHEYRNTLKTVSYIVYDYLKRGYHIFSNKTVKLRDIYNIAKLNYAYNENEHNIPEIGYATFKACVKKAVNPDRLINTDSSDISYVYNYQTFKQLNSDCYYNFNMKDIVPV